MKKALFFIASFMLSQAHAASIVAYWEFNNGLLDVTSTPISTTANNVVITSGRFARSISFDGSTSSARVSDDAALDFAGGDFSISFWMFPKVTSGTSSIINKRGTGNQGDFSGFSIGLTESGGQFSLNATVDDGQGKYISCNSCGGTYDFLAWYQVSMVYSNDKLSVYVNGVSDSEMITSGMGVIDNNLPMAFGANLLSDGQETVVNQHYNGLLDEVKIYNDALDLTDVASLFSSDNESVFSTRLGAVSENNEYLRDTTYQAPSDGFIIVYQSAGRCNTSNYTDIYIGKTPDNISTLVGRIGGYNSVTVPVAKDEFWRANHRKKYSTCRASVIFRPIY